VSADSISPRHRLRRGPIMSELLFDEIERTETRPKKEPIYADWNLSGHRPLAALSFLTLLSACRHEYHTRSADMAHPWS